ncbi:MAG: hypothetical protein Q4Q17_02515 [Tissierellia bacterium]|nr:hypothetical protein [Tissierellia bacterium]
MKKKHILYGLWAIIAILFGFMIRPIFTQPDLGLKVLFVALIVMIIILIYWMRRTYRM